MTKPTWADPWLPLLEVAAQLLPMSVTDLMFELFAVEGNSPKTRTGAVLTVLVKADVKIKT